MTSRYALGSELEKMMMNPIETMSPLDGSDLNLRQVEMLCNHIYGQQFPIRVKVEEFSKDARIDGDVNDLIHKGYLKQDGDGYFVIQELRIDDLIAKLSKPLSRT